MKILVVGGAGYIGSHMVKRLQETKYQVEILDNLSTGHELNTQNYKLYKYDLCNKEEVYQILKENQYDCVMHFASSIDVQESFLYPKNIMKIMSLILRIYLIVWLKLKFLK